MAESHRYRQGAEMYRIELKPGEESVFRTIEELAIGIRNGLITPKSRIYHNASQKWLPIEFHPHYKKALELPAMTSGERPAVGIASPRASAPITIPAPAPAPAPVPARAPVSVAAAAGRPSSSGLVFVQVEEPEADVAVAELPVFDAAVPSPVADLPPITYSEPVQTGVRRPRPRYLGLAAAALIAGAYVAVSAALPDRKTSAEQAPAVPVAEVTVPPTQATTIDSAATGNVATGPASTSGPTFGGGPAAPAAPKRSITMSIGASPAATAHADSSSIEPPPADVDLSIPSLPQGDSLAPFTTTDSNAIRRILRAVGGKGVTADPAKP